MKSVIKIAFFITLFFGVQLVNAQDEAMKTRLIRIFPKYIEWDNSNDLTEFNITVLSQSKTLSDALKVSLADKSVNKTPIIISTYSKIKNIKNCQILVVDNTYNIQSVIKKIGNYQTLLITDQEQTDNFMINFVYVDYRFKFELNVGALNQYNFKYNPNLSSVASKILNQKIGDLNSDGKEEKQSNSLTPKSNFSESESSTHSFQIDTVINDNPELTKKPIFDSSFLEKNRQLLLEENKNIEEALAELDTTENLQALMNAEQKLIDSERSILALQKKFNEANQLAIANQKLFDQEKINTKAIKSKNQILFWGILISFVLLLTTIYFLFLGKRLNVKVKKALNEVSEVNEELNQTNEELETQRNEIERQKQVVEEAHNDIKDSINYAKRIQNAILPATSLIKKQLPESFVLYRPKDIVAGDFYWRRHRRFIVDLPSESGGLGR